MREQEDLTKYLYMENIENLKKIAKMSMEDYLEFCSKNEEANKKIVFAHKEDEMLKLFNVSTIRNNKNKIIDYIDSKDNTVLTKVTEDDCINLQIPLEYFRKHYDTLSKFRICQENMIFHHYNNAISFDTFDNSFNYTGCMSFPSYDSMAKDNLEEYNKEKRNASFYIMNINNHKVVFDMVVDCRYYNLDENGTCKAITVNTTYGRINCKIISGFYLLEINNDKIVLSSWEAVKEIAKIKLSEHTYLNVDSIDKVLLPIFNMMDSYVNADFKKEKQYELNFINGHR